MKKVSDQVKEMIGKMQAENIARQRLQLTAVQRDYVFVHEGQEVTAVW